MGKTEQEIAELFITLFEANITDPLTGRLAKGKKWIYDDAPRLDLAEYPRISVTPVDSTYTQVGVGLTEQLEDVTIAVDVYSRKDDKINVTGTGDAERAEQIVDFLAKRCREVIRANHSTFLTNDILHVIPETKNRSVIEDDLIIERMTFKALSVNS